MRQKIYNWIVFLFFRRQLINQLLHAWANMVIARAELEFHMKRPDIPNELFLQLKGYQQIAVLIEKRIEEDVLKVQNTKRPLDWAKLFSTLYKDMEAYKKVAIPPYPQMN